MKELPKPILHALKRAKISPALSTDFSQFLNQYPDSESHTLYLLNDKKQKIEEVVQELYGVPINKQSTWTKETLKKPDSPQSSVINFKHPIQSNIHIKQSFKEWKQENGFFSSSSFELGNIYTFIRIQPFVDENFKQQFCWSFNKAKYGKKGWHMEKSIKNIKTDLIHNKHKPTLVKILFFVPSFFLTASKTPIPSNFLL